MAIITNTCYQCGMNMIIEVEQSHVFGELCWSSSYHCSNCGLTTESDNIGFPPDDIRHAMLEQQGEWGIRVDEPRSKNVTVKVLRQHFELSLKEATFFLKKIPGYLLKGTQTEVEWIQHLLQLEGVQSEIEKLEEKNKKKIELFDVTDLKIKE